MKLYYFKSDTGNFGDDLNPWLWSRLLPGLLDGQDDTLFVGIGTLLNHRLPPGVRKIVFGAGAGYGARPVIDSSWSIRCVRGPLTAEALGLAPSLAVTDPAALICTLALPGPRRDWGIAFMPRGQRRECRLGTGLYQGWHSLYRSALDDGPGLAGNLLHRHTGG